MEFTTFHSIAHFAGGQVGHPFSYQCACQQAVEKLGAQFFAYIPCDCKKEDYPNNWIPWFHPTFNSRGRRAFWKECLALFKKRPLERAKRIFFIEYYGRRDFRLFITAAFLSAKKRDFVWIVYRDDLTYRRKKDRFVIFFFSKLLKWRLGKRFVALSDSQALAEYYSSHLKWPCHVLPIPHTEYLPIVLNPEEKEKIVCTWPGHPRKEKGTEEIERLVQIQDPFSHMIELDLSGATYLPPIKNQISIHLRKAHLTREEYIESLLYSDIVLLPYDAKRYLRRTSGILVEAVTLGKLPFVKEGSWLANELKKFDLSELIIDWKHPEFFAQIIQLFYDTSVRKKLKKMQEEYIRMHSIDSFSRKMGEIAAS